MPEPVHHVADLPRKTVGAFAAEICLRNVIRPELGGTDNLSINALEVAAGSGTPFHIHHYCEEAWIVMEGRGAIRVAEGWHAFGAGDVLHCPKDVPHQVVALGDATLRYLAVTAPAVDLITDNIVLSEFDSDALAAAEGAK